MVRKLHPTEYTRKIMKHGTARWYADGKRYGEPLDEDLAIRNLVGGMHESAAISQVEIERYPGQVLVTLHTARPGIVIGRKGDAVKKLRQDLEALTDGKKVKIE